MKVNQDKMSHSLAAIILLLGILLLILLLIYVIDTLDPYEDKWIELLLVIVAISLFIGICLFSITWSSILVSIKKNSHCKRILILIFILSLTFTLASVSYIAYRQNPKSYYIDIDYENRYIELIKEERRKRAVYAAKFDSLTNNHLRLFKQLKGTFMSYQEINGTQIFMNDVVSITIEDCTVTARQAPEMRIRIYSRKTSALIFDRVSMQEPFQDFIDGHLVKYERKLQEIHGDMVVSTDYRWSYGRFLWYYLTHQITPVSSALIFLHAVQLLLIFSIPIVARPIVYPEIKLWFTKRDNCG